MAMKRVVTVDCDLCERAGIPADEATVIRVGSVHDRPDGCTRLDIGPECRERPIADAIAIAEKVTADG